MNDRSRKNRNRPIPIIGRFSPINRPINRPIIDLNYILKHSKSNENLVYNFTKIFDPLKSLQLRWFYVKILQFLDILRLCFGHLEKGKKSKNFLGNIEEKTRK